jgi:nucleoside-diphosphate-sugar epimerase
MRALVRPSSDCTLLERLNVEIIKGDLTDARALQNALRNCRQVYHLAAYRTENGSSKEQYFATNVQGTAAVARAAIAAGVGRFVYVSSTGAYGVLKKGTANENTQLWPNTYYRESKVLAEKLVLSLHRDKGLPAVIARVSGVMGPRSSKWIGLFRTIATGRFQGIDSGENYSHFGYVTDIVAGLRRCAETSGIEGRCYLITGKHPIKTKDLLGAIAEELGKENPHASVPAAPFSVLIRAAQVLYTRFGYELPRAHRYEFFLKNNVFDISKAKRELGYHPEVSSREAIRRTIQWHREQGHLK